MFGDQALKLVTEAKACLNLDNVKPDELIRSLILETKQLHAHLTTLLSTLEHQSAHLSPVELSGLQSQLLMLHLIVSYNKRALLIYHNIRLDLLFSHLSRHSFALSILFARHPHLRTTLSPAEQDQLKRYSDLMHRTKLQYLDLSPNLRLDVADQQVYEPVPTELLVTVKVNRDLEEVWLSSNQTAPTTFRKDQTVTISRADVRGLIGRGWVTVVDGSS
ncbi:related to PSF1-subunit of the GINS complex [Sporisorium reilianum f. sp. reilianum]|uniref:DNA replication complex GINS protein PSF1 n=1 Tax=Sporisorium reilianum f. sp. reilianum TaxID=72559 RepID=A0A2N8UJ83_9BASI|nr:related to PSF1-subunit of the GINS complex [Sporisorium reilianum f. sp. reilianum]